MQAEAHIVDLLPAYILGALDEADAHLVDTHLSGCYLCRTELGSFEAVSQHLPLSIPVASPSPALKHRLMERIQPPPSRKLDRVPPSRPPLLQRLTLVFGAISLLLIIALAAANLMRLQRLNHQEVFTGPTGMRSIALNNNSSIAPLGSGFVLISADGQDGALVVDALPALDPAQQYQVWLIRDGQTLRGPSFIVDESGYRGARIVAPDSLLTYSDIIITIEPVESDDPSPTGEEVLAGSLHNE